MKFDGTITLGSLIATATVVAGLIVGWTRVEAQVAAQDDRLAKLEAAQDTDVRALESRLRAVEVQGAATGADIRNILTGLEEIKAGLARLARDVP